MPLDMTINLDRLRSVRLKLRRGLVKLTMCSAVGLDERYSIRAEDTDVLGITGGYGLC